MANFQEELELEQKERESLVKIDYKLVSFTLADKDYGIDIMRVREIAKGDRFSYVPNSPPFVRGVYNLRGEIIPIIDLRVFFGLPERDRSADAEDALESILILRIEENTLGIIVDSVDRVIGIDSRAIQPTHPLFADIHVRYIYGVVEKNDKLYILLDVDRVFGVETPIEEEMPEDDDLEEENSNTYEAPVESAVAAPSAELPVESATESTPVPENLPFAADASMFMPDDVEEAPVDVEAVSPDAEEMAPNMEDARTEEEAAPAPQPVDDTELRRDGLERAKATLASLSRFMVSPTNEEWFKNRYEEWQEDRGPGAPINGLAEANEFLAVFYSHRTRRIWDVPLMEEFQKVAPTKKRGFYHVWHMGCSTGEESYSIACSLLESGALPGPLKIYAQDNDLIAISTAGSLTVKNTEALESLEKFLEETDTGLQFNEAVRGSITFEFHDITNYHSLPGVDLIVARDVISFLTPEKQESLYNDIDEMADVGVVLILGDHEKPLDMAKWEKITGVTNLSAYKKLSKVTLRG